MHIFMTIAITTCVLMTSVAQAADPGTRQIQRPPMQQQRGSVQQLQITPEYLNQQITALKQQVAHLQGQVNALRSVVHISQNGTTIQAENLSLNAVQALTMTAGKDTNLTVGEDLSLTSGKDVLVKSGKNTNIEGAATLHLKAPQVKLNNGSKSVAHVTSTVAGGKVVSGSTTVFVP
ncbi:MAG: hypothetical protein OEZ57_01270 [Nitrospirota bacterium]|nr:hypothetical protein [Nitrospirota bacterium]MDH5585247.1 hypothetical protein [Nitrospirota bacterium]MDH5773530.1 hypothetical protein [Nitrospirota bacterium]